MLGLCSLINSTACNSHVTYHIHNPSFILLAEALDELIKAGANVNAQNQIAKTTPLMCAIKGTFQSFRETHSKRVECVKLLLAAGADGKLCDLRGNDAFDSVDDAIKESAMRNIGSVEEEMEEMRKAVQTNEESAFKPDYNFKFANKFEDKLSQVYKKIKKKNE